MSTIAAGNTRGIETAPAQNIGGASGFNFRAPINWYSKVKGAADFTMAVVLFVATAPVMLLAMLAIKLTSRGPAIYAQTRLGFHGKPFTIYKLRTMVHKCESLTGARWATPNDPRTTRLGRLLRKTHIDELPQLWNVLKGEMSLIGPRPERPEFIPQLERAIPFYGGRMAVKPGVTGFAQVQLPPDTNLASVRLKLAYDLYYVRHLGAWLDARILLSTAGKVAGLTFAVMARLFCLPRLETVEHDINLTPSEAAASRVRTA
jgi:lipopolysaccharide/colanic/teichoic acid biosynthesis glycosyltransferase